MGDNNNITNKSRRWFLTGGLSGKGKKEMVKMLTADGRLVQIEKTVLDRASKKQKSSNEEIYNWMENPSKENNS